MLAILMTTLLAATTPVDGDIENNEAQEIVVIEGSNDSVTFDIENEAEELSQVQDSESEDTNSEELAANDEVLNLDDEVADDVAVADESDDVVVLDDAVDSNSEDVVSTDDENQATDELATRDDQE